MKLTCSLLLIAALTSPASAIEYSVVRKGMWPDSWPTELDSLREQAKTFEGPLLPLLHYAIRFESREQFERAWPHILKLKSRGAPIVLRRGENFWLAGQRAGVCIHTPPAGRKPVSGDKADPSRPHESVYIELVVDGKIVDLNRIRLPRNTPIHDERFANKP